MTPLAVTLLLAWRDPARNFAFILGFLGVLIFIVLLPQVGAYWLILVWPAFLISTALTLPTFSQFERAMPVTVPQLLWSRILASLGPIWIALLLGVWLMLVNRQPLSTARQALECSAFFGLVTLQLFLPFGLTDVIEGWLLHLSAALPANPILMALALLAAMAPIYWALETVFQQVEFPNKSKESA